MPLFFLISGYLFKIKKEIIVYSKQLFKRYIIPYFVLAICMLMLVIVIEKQYNLIPHYLLGIVYSRGTTHWMPQCSPLWFLTCLVVALFLFNLIMYTSKYIGVALALVCCLGSYAMYLLNAPKLFWNADSALMAVCFIGLGFICVKNKKMVFENGLWPTFCIVAAVLGLVCIHFNTIVSFDDNKYGNLALMISGAVSASYAISCLIYHFHPFAKMFTFFGKHTIFIMGFDYFSGAIGRKAMRLLGFENWLPVFIVKLIIIIIGIYLWYWLIHFIKNEKIQELLRY